MNFDYQIVRLWEIPVADLVEGDIGVVPLAPLGRLPNDVSVEDGLASIINRLVDRLLKEASPDQANNLVTASFLMSGLRIERDLAYKLFQGASAMHESTTYMAILEEGMEKGIGIGMEKGIRTTILRQGQKRFGPPTDAHKAKLESVTDINHLEHMADLVLDVSSWDELLSSL